MEQLQQLLGKQQPDIHQVLGIEKPTLESLLGVNNSQQK